jgi:hypothetical protein
MKKIIVFAGVLAASTVMGASAAWAAPTPGTFYEVNGTFTLGSALTAALNCNPGDLADTVYFADATHTANYNTSYPPPASQVSSSGEPTGLTATFLAPAASGDTVSGTLLCLASQAASSPAPTPSTTGGVY